MLDIITKNLPGLFVVLMIYHFCSCASPKEDPRIQEAREELSEILTFIPRRSMDSDSLITEAEKLDYEGYMSLIANLESGYKDVISKSRAKKERDEKIKAQFDLREGFHIKTKYAVQESMDDPDSFVHEGTTHIDKGDTIYISMRFKMRDPGGVIRSFLIESKVDIDGNVLEGDISQIPE